MISPSPKSKGIPPSQFHTKRQRPAKGSQSTPATTPAVIDMDDFHRSIEERLLQQAKQDHATELAMQRSAFKQLTCLKRWPLQEMAMQHLEQLKEQQKQEPHVKTAGETKAISPGTVKCTMEEQEDASPSFSELSESSSSSSSSSASCNSSLEPKRIMRNTVTSPAKSRLQQQYREELEAGRYDDEPLWSRQPRIFATEKAQGKRKYVVGHFGRIVDWYWRKLDPKHLYEVINENTPCRLYFDLEYNKAYNPDIDQNALLEDFRHELAKEISDKFQLTLTSESIVDLDSSNETKFSRHWIVHLQGLFSDASAVGRFVKQLVGRLAEEIATGQLQTIRPTLARHLFVQTKDEGKESCFIDLGVYTRNRLFRCLGSSKFGKTTSLVIADSNQFPIQLPNPKSPPPASVTTLEDYIAANDWRQHARVLAETLVIPLASSRKHMKILAVPEEPNRSTLLIRESHPQRIGPPRMCSTSTSTPFPSLDKYVMEVLATRGGVQGIIRAWSMEYTPLRQDPNHPQATCNSGSNNNKIPISITYQLSRNRYCEWIGRQHKSNHVYWIIDVSTWKCIQGCFDPECHGRGQPIPITPLDRLQSIQKEFQQWQDDQFELALLSLQIDDDDAKNATLTATPEPSRNNNNTAETNPNQDKPTTTTKTTMNTTMTSIQGKSQTQESPENEVKRTTVNDGDDAIDDSANTVNKSTILSDEALLDAVSSHPNLFP